MGLDYMLQVIIEAAAAAGALGGPMAARYIAGTIIFLLTRESES